jgi:hypothetical protein
MSDSSAVGLHLGERALHAVEVRREGGCPVLWRVGRASLPVELAPEVLLREEAQAQLAEALRGLFEASGIDRGGVALSVGGNFSVIKRVPLEVASDEERREQIAWEASQHLIDPASDYCIDYHAFGRTAFLIAVRRQVADACRGVCERAGLGLKGVEVDPLSLFYACRMASGDAPGEGGRGASAVYVGGRWASCISTWGGDLTAVEVVRLDRGGWRLRAGSEEERMEAKEAAVRALGRRIAGGLVPERRNGGTARERRVLLSGDRQAVEEVGRWWTGMEPLSVAFIDPFARADLRALPAGQRPLLDWRTGFAVSAGAAYKNL